MTDGSAHPWRARKVPVARGGSFMLDGGRHATGRALDTSEEER